jgi:hypothetical protein
MNKITIKMLTVKLKNRRVSMGRHDNSFLIKTKRLPDNEEKAKGERIHKEQICFSMEAMRAIINCYMHIMKCDKIIISKNNKKENKGLNNDIKNS